ncbi:unnamed protein product [Auanema sp. JU1783]|nr:unnamed protein product [Auanema sp. JU1783]
MTALDCPPNYSGLNCDLPICNHQGYLDLVNKVCVCWNNYAPPFCRTCLPGYWGAECNLKNIVPTEVSDLMHSTIGDSIVIMIIICHFICACLLAYWLFKDCSLPKVELSDDPPTYEEAVNGSDGRLLAESQFHQKTKSQYLFGFFLLFFISLSTVMCVAFYLSYSNRNDLEMPSFLASVLVGVKYALFSFTSTFTIGVIILFYVQFIRILEITKTIWIPRVHGVS